MPPVLPPTRYTKPMPIPIQIPPYREPNNGLVVIVTSFRIKVVNVIKNG